MKSIGTNTNIFIKIDFTNRKGTSFEICNSVNSNWNLKVLSCIDMSPTTIIDRVGFEPRSSLAPWPPTLRSDYQINQIRHWSTNKPTSKHISNRFKPDWLSFIEIPLNVTTRSLCASAANGGQTKDINRLFQYHKRHILAFPQCNYCHYRC